MTQLWKWFLHLSGWNTSVAFPYHHLQKFVVIVGSHTSNWDFIIGLGYRRILGLQYVKFLAKKELFRPPFGWLFRWLGGIPVDRRQQTNLVGDAAMLFQTHEKFAIALSPEGTRSKVEKLRTGFYFIARQSQVPIVMVGLDYDKKTLVFGEAFMPTDLERDFNRIYQFYSSVQAKHPGQGITAP